MPGVHEYIEVIGFYPDAFVGIQAWRRDFYRRCECSLKGLKKLTLDVPGGPLNEVETGLVQKKVVRVPNTEGGPLRVNP